jgi:hypothetical protein
MKPLTLRCARFGKIGLFLTLALLAGFDMLMKALGGAVDEHGLVMAAMPLVTLFAVLAVGGEIAYRTLASAKHRP